MLMNNPAKARASWRNRQKKVSTIKGDGMMMIVSEMNGIYTIGDASINVKAPSLTIKGKQYPVGDKELTLVPFRDYMIFTDRHNTVIEISLDHKTVKLDIDLDDKEVLDVNSFVLATGVEGVFDYVFP